MFKANLTVSGKLLLIVLTVADPGFPVGGGRRPVGGGAELRHVCFSAITYAKSQELDPVMGARAGGAPWIRQWLNVYL